MALVLRRSAMGYEYHVRLFRHGHSQAVDIPRALELPGEEVVMRKDGDRIIIESVEHQKRSMRSLIEWLQSQPPLDESIGEIEDLPPEDDIRL